MNGRTNSSGSSVNDLQIPLDPCTNLECVAGNAQVELTWTDPLNKYATPEGEVAEDPDQLVSVWHHTVVIRKVGSAPVGIDDGIVVVSSEVKNQYQSTAYIDTGLVNDTTYYYGVFAINEDGVPGIPGIESVTPKLGTPLSELAEGTIIKINENGSPVEFYLAKHNYEPGLNGQGRELVVRKDAHSNQVWNLNQDPDLAPLNTYGTSLIDTWLNTTYKSVFSEALQQAMGSTTFIYSPGGGTRNTSSLSRAVFILSLTEYGIPYIDMRFNAEGSALPIADVLAPSQGTYITQEWTRTPYLGMYQTPDRRNTCCVNCGQWNTVHDRFASIGPENSIPTYPCFALPSTARVNDALNLLEDSL